MNDVAEKPKATRIRKKAVQPVSDTPAEASTKVPEKKTRARRSAAKPVTADAVKGAVSKTAEAATPKRGPRKTKASPAAKTNMIKQETAMPASTSTTTEFPRTGSAASTKDIEVQLEQLREDIAALAKTVAAVGNEKASEVKSKAKRAAADATDASYQIAEAAKNQALTWERDLEGQIRANPIQSVAIAAGVGFLFALLSRR